MLNDLQVAAVRASAWPYLGKFSQMARHPGGVLIVGNVHGNEPASVAAILSHGVFPSYCTVVPLANPLGLASSIHRYYDNDTYFAQYAYLCALVDYARPKLIVNLHEDDEAFEHRGFYVYTYGEVVNLANIAIQAVANVGLRIANEDSTWEVEQIFQGIILASDDSPFDPSVEDFAQYTYGIEGIVVETPSNVWPVRARVRALRAVLDVIPQMWSAVGGKV